MHLQVRGAPDTHKVGQIALIFKLSQCTYRCVVLPDNDKKEEDVAHKSQCTYRCVVLLTPTRSGRSL